MFLQYKNKASRRDIFEEKGKANNFVKIKNPIESKQLTSQTPNHVEITNILSTRQRESRIINC